MPDVRSRCRQKGDEMSRVRRSLLWITRSGTGIVWQPPGTPASWLARYPNASLAAFAIALPVVTGAALVAIEGIVIAVLGHTVSEPVAIVGILIFAVAGYVATTFPCSSICRLEGVPRPSQAESRQPSRPESRRHARF